MEKSIPKDIMDAMYKRAEEIIEWLKTLTLMRPSIIVVGCQVDNVMARSIALRFFDENEFRKFVSRKTREGYNIFYSTPFVDFGSEMYPNVRKCVKVVLVNERKDIAYEVLLVL